MTYFDSSQFSNLKHFNIQTLVHKYRIKLTVWENLKLFFFYNYNYKNKKFTFNQEMQTAGLE